MAVFTEDEKAAFHFIDDLHPASFAMVRGKLKGDPVAIMCWLDVEKDVMRPLAVLLTADGLMEGLEIPQHAVIKLPEEDEEIDD